MIKKRYLVTGGTGFIGSALVRRLLQLGHHVRVLDNNSRGSSARLAEVADDIEFILGDIRDANVVSRSVEGTDSVLHLAYVNGTEFFYSRPELVLDIAIRGMLNVIDACRAHGVREMVLASSSEAYQTPPEIPTTEQVPLVVPDVMNPRYSYGGGKLTCELMAVNYGRTGFDRMTIFRPHNVYGPDMGWEHVLPQMVMRAIDRISKSPKGAVDFPIQGDGTQTRAFVHIHDFIDGLMCQIEKGKHLNIYHIGNPEEITILQVAREIFTLLGRKPRIIAGPLPDGSTQRRCPDITKLQGLGFQPQIPFTKGLPDLVAWYVNSHEISASVK